MKIRATKKLLNIARIKVTKDMSPLIDKMPGEWYSSIVSMGIPGKLAIHFLHFPTLVSVIVPEKSLNKAIKELSNHVESLLKRQGFYKMLPEYQLSTIPEIFSTNNRSMLAYINDMHYNIEYHLSRQRPVAEIEDNEFENLFGGKLGGVDYITPRKILSEYMNKMVSR
jgi:hypothetical protein